MTLIPRADWGAAQPNYAGNSLATHPKGVAVHWEGPHLGSRDHSQCAALVLSIQKDHMSLTPRHEAWADIAYNFLVCEHGYVFEGRGIRHGSAANGTSDANFNYYAVCALVGENDPLTPELLSGLKEAIRDCQLAGAGTEIKGHRDFFPTTCPGDGLYVKVRAGLLSPDAPAPKPPTSAPGPVTTTTVPPFPGVLQMGDSGDGVRALQARLAARGWRITVDGSFGPQTRAVVRAFQTDKKLTLDGICGPKTWAALWTTPITA
ncbi:MAG: peptidoglycan recognition protein family protein [Mycobacteriaceae bacterium]